MYPNYKILNIKIRPDSKDKCSPFPVVKHPCQEGEYSVSPEGLFEKSRSRIRYLAELSPTEFPFSLNEEEIIESDDERLNFEIRDLDHMFFYLRSCKGKFLKRTPNLQFPQLDADFVCTREVLQLIMCAPYETKQSWTIAASSYHNTIYLSEVQTEENKSSVFGQDHLEKLLKANWLKKLRMHCVVAATDEKLMQPCASKQSENGQYYSVFSMEICGMRLLFDAPVLAKHFSNQPIGQPTTFVDIQLRLDTMNRAEWTNHNLNEVLKWWVDCFLVGIENINIAYHDKNAFVHKIQYTSVRDLRKECDNDWSPNVCGNFLASFLSTIKNMLRHVNCANTIYSFEYDAKMCNIVYRVISERSEFMFIPDWFRTMMSK